jgi:hypothetical protein
MASDVQHAPYLDWTVRTEVGGGFVLQGEAAIAGEVRTQLYFPSKREFDRWADKIETIVASSSVQAPGDSDGT